MGTKKGTRLLSAALCLSVDDIVASRLIRHIDEEITTAALLGAMASNIAWASALAIDVDLPPFSWVHYSKHGKNEKSEAYTGADFALIFRMGINRYRAAVFQAKRAQSNKLNFKYLQISPAREGYSPEPQMLRLYKYGLKLLAEMPKNENGNSDRHLTAEGLDFVHYLIYHQDDAYAAPLSDYRLIVDRLQVEAVTRIAKDPDCLESVREAWKTFPDSLLDPGASTTNLSDLFESAFFSPANQRVPGWIDLNTSSAANLFISETRRLMDVFEGSGFSAPRPAYDGGMNLVGMANSRQPLLRTAFPNPSIQPQPTTSKKKKLGMT